jgi:glutamine amidotransferase
MPPVTIIDSGGANIASLQFALTRLGAESELTTDPDMIRAAERVILPGVGAAADAMDKLRGAGLDEVIPGLEQPVLGICLGMQLLFESSDEEETQCLSIIEGRARLFEVAEDRPVPHMGWNRVKKSGSAHLLDGIPDDAYFYFVHSYAVDMVAETMGSTSYGQNFTSVVRMDNFMGTQFHPERSGKHGAQLLRNFLQQTR